jgi:restriction endonuclease S subunit
MVFGEDGVPLYSNSNYNRKDFVIIGRSTSTQEVDEILNRPVPPSTIVSPHSLANSVMLPMAVFRLLVLYYVCYYLKSIGKKIIMSRNVHVSSYNINISLDETVT